MSFSEIRELRAVAHTEASFRHSAGKLRRPTPERGPPIHQSKKPAREASSVWRRASPEERGQLIYIGAQVSSDRQAELFANLLISLLCPLRSVPRGFQSQRHDMR